MFPTDTENLIKLSIPVLKDITQYLKDKLNDIPINLKNYPYLYGRVRQIEYPRESGVSRHSPTKGFHYKIKREVKRNKNTSLLPLRDQMKVRPTNALYGLMRW